MKYLQINTMKKIIYTLIAVLAFAKSYAQAPLGIPYQAAARKANGQALTNTAIKVRFSILDSVATGTVAFKETHTTNTNALGMFNLNVGMGTAITGTLAGVNWGNNAKFLQVELDTTATGNNYSFMGVQQLMSVPYAFYSQTTGDTTLWRKNGNDIYTLKKVGIGKISDGTSILDIGGRYIQIAKDSSGESGLVKNIPLNTPGYDGSLILGFVPNYSTVELHHQYGGYNGGANANNFYTTFNSTEGGVSSGERMRIAPNGNIGIGTTNPQRSLHVSAAMRLEPIAVAPLSPAKGDMYFDSILNKLRVYDGSVWQNCW
jgi:hypothetical protein